MFQHSFPLLYSWSHLRRTNWYTYHWGEHMRTPDIGKLLHFMVFFFVSNRYQSTMQLAPNLRLNFPDTSPPLLPHYPCYFTILLLPYYPCYLSKNKGIAKMRKRTREEVSTVSTIYNDKIQAVAMDLDQEAITALCQHCLLYHVLVNRELKLCWHFGSW